jgi:Cu-Zn family superoxide dismutase
MRRTHLSLIAVVLCWFWFVPVVRAASARAELKDARGTHVGEAAFQDSPEGVKVTATFTDLPPGEHAIHVHAVGKCEPPFESSGAHFNPTEKKHGRDNPQGAHAGDMPNLQVSPMRRATIDVLLPKVSLNGGPAALPDGDGASLVVHERADDYRTDPAGEAGGRIACGVILGPKS